MMLSMLLRIYALPLMICLVASPVGAEVNGFATLGAAWFSNPNADFAYNNLSSGAGNSRTIDLGLDSNLGLQWTTKPAQSVQLTAQTVIARDASNNLVPSITLANANFYLPNNLSLLVGRTQNPNFLYSDVRQVHFALPWIRPPREVYGVTSIFNYDGVQASFQHVLSDQWVFHTNFGVAQAVSDYSRDAGDHVDQLHADNMKYMSISLQNAAWTVKLSYEQGNLTTQSQRLQDAFTLLSQSDAALSDRLALVNKDYQFATLGARYESDDYLALFEYAWRHLDAYFGERSGAYVTLGKRFDKFMPYVTLARTWTTVGNSSNSIAQQLYASVTYSASSASLGGSYQLSDHVTLKGELQVVAPDPGSRWAYEAYSTQYDYNTHAQDVLLSFSLNTVF